MRVTVSSRTWAWLRLVGGAAILGLLLWRLGATPFLDGVRRVDPWSLAAAATIGLLTTVCCAWRWSVVARGLGVDIPLRTAVAAYYGSQFLNTTLPGGVLGDVHRAVRHGRQVGDVGRSLRAVWWERTAGQVVQAALSIVVLWVLPSPVQSSMPLVAALVGGAAVAAVVLGRVLPHDGPSWWGRTMRTIRADLRVGLLARRAWPAVVLMSAVVVAGHVVMFLIAARTAGVSTGPARMVPLAVLVLLAMSVPTNIGGWGPREGMAAWTFAAAGLGADQGLTTAVVYGVMALVATLPGAGVLAARWFHRDRGRPLAGAADARSANATPTGLDQRPE